MQDYKIPGEIRQMLQYTQHLAFEDRPDYKYLKSLLQKVLKKNYPQLKKMQDIDILSNNNEEKLTEIMTNAINDSQHGSP